MKLKKMMQISGKILAQEIRFKIVQPSTARKGNSAMFQNLNVFKTISKKRKHLKTTQ